MASESGERDVKDGRREGWHAEAGLVESQGRDNERGRAMVVAAAVAVGVGVGVEECVCMCV